MTIATIQGRDYTGSDLPATPIPNVQLATYITGSVHIVASEAQLAAHPGIIRIDQSPANTPLDETADVLDFENGAATLSDLAPWVQAANTNFAKGTRPGQRKPCIYVSAAQLTGAVNALVAAKITECNIWVAHWGVGASTAQSVVESTAGTPFQVVGFQYENGAYDSDFFSLPWLEEISKAPVVLPPLVPAPDSIPVPSTAGIPAVVTWHGEAGLDARRTVFTQEQWDAIKWEA